MLLPSLGFRLAEITARYYGKVGAGSMAIHDELDRYVQITDQLLILTYCSTAIEHQPRCTGSDLSSQLQSR